MKNILLVEDDEMFRAALRNILSRKFQVLEASTGRVALELLMRNDVDLILSDIHLPDATGFDVLECSQKCKPTPAILMSGSADPGDEAKARELGVLKFLRKPFSEHDIFDFISCIIGGDSSLDGEVVDRKQVDLDSQFCKLPIEDFIADKETEYEIYIRMSATRYIKIVHKGDKISQCKMGSFREKGVTHLFVRKEEFSKLVGFTVSVSKAVSHSDQVDRAKKMRFMKYTGEMIMQQAYVAGTDEALFKNAKDFLTTSLDVLTEDQETFALLDLLSNHTDYLYAHSLGVSMFAVMIAKQLGWQSAQAIFKLSFAGLFHDIGKKEIPAELLQKPRALLTQQERALLETHTTRGMEILQCLKTASTEVIQVAYEHHEDILGQGFPRGVNRHKLHPFSLIVAVANIFCEYTLPGPQNPAPKSAPEALEAMKIFKSASMDPKIFEALCKVVVSMK